jgi:hypothetical protein
VSGEPLGLEPPAGEQVRSAICDTIAATDELEARRERARYTGTMQLRNARLCLDCEEVHDAQQCPMCASESFAFITRWVPAPERRGRPRPPEPPNAGELQAYRLMLEQEQPPASGWRLVKRGAVGLALFGVAGWIWRKDLRTRRSDSTSRTG